MKVLDAELDTHPTTAKVTKMAELRIRNLLCFSELQTFNDTGKWRNKHPLIIHHSERFKLEELRQRNPEEFLKQYANCNHNIKRYKSYLKNPDRADKKASDKKNLQKHKERIIIFESILKEDDKRNNNL